MKNVITFFIIILGLVLQSCEEDSPKKAAKEYCNCWKEWYHKSKHVDGICIDRVSDKYPALNYFFRDENFGKDSMKLKDGTHEKYMKFVDEFYKYQRETHCMDTSNFIK